MRTNTEPTNARFEPTRKMRPFSLAGSEPTFTPAEPTKKRQYWFSKTQDWRGL